MVAQGGQVIFPKFCQAPSRLWSPDSSAGNICTVLIITPGAGLLHNIRKWSIWNPGPQSVHVLLFIPQLFL